MAAGLGFKTFTTGEVLTAADTNGYLMQGLLVFASAAARDAAITSPQEGQACYLKDTDAVLTYSGTAWVGFDDSNAIQNSIVDAKGDIVAASGNDTPARLAAGNNGETLVADSSTATGLRYTGGTVQANPVLNSAFQVWQRSTSVSVAASLSVYTADRWNMQTGANQAMTISRQATGDTTNLPFIQFCARVQRNSGQTGTGAMGFANSFETINSRPFAGKTVNVSFYARKGADYSPTSSVLQVNLYSGTGTDQSINTAGYTGVSAVIQENKTLTATWQRFTTTAQAVSASATELALQFAVTPTGTASTNDYFEVTGVQLDVGSVALPFRTYAGTIQGELAACQRYYFKTTTGRQGVGYAKTTTIAECMTFFPVEMRLAPSALEQTGTAADYLLVFQNSAAACSAVPTFENGNKNNATIRFTVASGLTAGNGLVAGSNSGSSFLAWSAEL